MCGPSEDVSYSKTGTAVASSDSGSVGHRSAPKGQGATGKTTVSSADLAADLTDIFDGYGITDPTTRAVFLGLGQDLLRLVRSGVAMAGTLLPAVRGQFGDNPDVAVAAAAEIVDALAAAAGVNGGYPAAPALKFVLVAGDILSIEEAEQKLADDFTVEEKSETGVLTHYVRDGAQPDADGRYGSEDLATVQTLLTLAQVQAANAAKAETRLAELAGILSPGETSVLN